MSAVVRGRSLMRRPWKSIPETYPREDRCLLWRRSRRKTNHRFYFLDTEYHGNSKAGRAGHAPRWGRKLDQLERTCSLISNYFRHIHLPKRSRGYRDGLRLLGRFGKAERQYGLVCLATGSHRRDTRRSGRRRSFRFPEASESPREGHSWTRSKRTVHVSRRSPAHHRRNWFIR
jgi:hypothetical protein